MTLLNFFKRHWKLAQEVAYLTNSLSYERNRNRGLKAHNTRMKREHDEKLIGLIASKEAV
jgi:hypothetical protein